MRRWFRRRRVVPRFYEGRGDRALVACAAFCTQGLERTTQPFPGHVLPCPGPRPGSLVLGARWGQWGVGLPGAGAEHSFCRAGQMPHLGVCVYTPMCNDCSEAGRLFAPL